MGKQEQNSDGRPGQTLSVSDAMNLAKGALEGIVVRLVGEVSEVSVKAGYKAAYFTVKDSKASLSCMMWNNRYNASGVDLRVGMLVELSGRFTLYALKGRMNFEVFSLSLAGEGMLRMQVAALARKLEAEGLMAARRKRPLPVYPETIGLVTSPRGAAVHDVLRTLRRRYPLARVLVAGVPVEGAQAPAALIEGMRCCVSAGAELILLVRGGGSFEDLMPFNDEALARSIAGMPVPVVTGIGHEPDNSIADMVSDVRASTPTAAAEAVAPSTEALSRQLDSAAAQVCSSQRNALASLNFRLQRFALMPLFQEPRRLFGDEAYSLDDLSKRLEASAQSMAVAHKSDLRQLQRRLDDALPNMLGANRAKLDFAQMSLLHSLQRVTQPHCNRVQSLEGRLVYQASTATQRFDNQLGVMAASLHGLSPLDVMSRGYAIARDGSGVVVKSVDAVSVGVPLTVSVDDGIIDCTVCDVHHVEISMQDWEEG